MRSDKYRKKSPKDHDSGLKKFTKIWSIFFLLVSAVFLGFLIYMDVLHLKYLCAAAGIIAVIILMIFPALYSGRFKKSRRIICLVLSILVLGVYGAGFAYMSGTIDFFSKITTVAAQTEPYYVIARAGDAFEGEEDIRGNTVQTYLTNEINYSEAKNILKKELDVEYEMAEDLDILAQGLLERAYDLIFVSDTHYTTVCADNSQFKSASKIIYTVRVPVETKDIAKDVDVTQDSFNIYVSGLDTEGSIDTVSRSDVNMIITVNPTAHEVLLTSIPRDYYIELPGRENAMDKLTHTGIYGIGETIAAVEKLTGLDMNYYVKVNYSTVTQLVDAIGGIEVDSDYTFTTHGMGVYYEFYEGVNYLDGSRALAFARERQSFSDGDLQRNKNQQLVLEGILKKAMSSATILTKYTTILNSIEDCVEINMSGKDIRNLIKMQTDGMPSWNIRKQSITGSVSEEYMLCYTGNITASVVMQDQESVVSAVDEIVEVMEKGK